MNLLKWFFVGGLVIMGATPALGAKGFVLGESGKCAVNDTGPNHADEFYYCGEQNKGCAGVTDNNSDRRYWLQHGDNVTKDGKTYWCCLHMGENNTSTQQLRQGPNWKIKEETVTENLGNGAFCTWQAERTICDTFANPAKRCTEATSCAAGLVKTDIGTCAAPCGDNQGFLNGACVECETTDRQGIGTQGVCRKCQANQFFSRKTLTCVNYSSMTRVPTGAHNECWMCPTPGTLYYCLKDVADNGRLTDNELKQACSLDNKDSNWSQWKLPPDIPVIKATAILAN